MRLTRLIIGAVINAERSALKAASFRDRLMKTRRGELQLLWDLYGKSDKKDKKKDTHRSSKKDKKATTKPDKKTPEKTKEKQQSARGDAKDSLHPSPSARGAEPVVPERSEKRRESDSSTRGKELSRQDDPPSESTTSQSEPESMTASPAQFPIASDSGSEIREAK